MLPPQHETHDQPEDQSLQEGMAVFDRDGEKIGTLKQRELRDGRLLVHHGRLFGHDIPVPQGAVARVDATGIHLSVPKQEAEHPHADSATGEAGAPPAHLDRTAPIVPPKRVEDDTPTEGPAGAAADAASKQQDLADQPGQVAPPGGEQLGHMGEQVRQATSELAANRLTHASERVSAVASALTQLAEQLRQSAQAALADYASTAAHHLDELAARLREQDKGQRDAN